MVREGKSWSKWLNAPMRQRCRCAYSRPLQTGYPSPRPKESASGPSTRNRGPPSALPPPAVCPPVGRTVSTRAKDDRQNSRVCRHRTDRSDRALPFAHRHPPTLPRSRAIAGRGQESSSTDRAVRALEHSPVIASHQRGRPSNKRMGKRIGLAPAAALVLALVERRTSSHGAPCRVQPTVEDREATNTNPVAVPLLGWPSSRRPKAG